MVTPIFGSMRNSGDMVAEMSILNKSDGSASWCSKNGATVITSINGPIEVRMRDEILGEATLELKILPESGLAGTRERYLEGLVRSAIKPCLLLGLHPRSLVQITSQVVSHAEDSLVVLDTVASTINSIILASVDAGLSMNYLLAAAVVHIPDAGHHVVCYSFPKDELILLESVGPYISVRLPEILKIGHEKCSIAYDAIRKKIEAKVERDNRWRDQS